MKEINIPIIEIKNKLDSISPSMCLAKWTQTTLHLHNGRTHSCHHPYPHVIPLDELKDNPSALHNTNYKKEQRKLMIEGKRPSECQYCWNVEDLDGYKKNEFFSDRITKSADSWSINKLDEISKLDYTADVNPTYVEVSFSNLCNFKCSYCSPVYSSRWQEEIEVHGPYPTKDLFNNLEYLKSQNELPINHKLHNPYVEAFWQWWPELIKTLLVFRITGGEPLLNDNTFKILEYFDKNPQPNLDFAINTNGCIPEKLFESFIEKISNLIKDKKIKSLQIYISLDGYGKQAEYSRYGLDYNQWVINFERMLKEIPDVKMTVMCTTNIFSLPNFMKFLELVLRMKLVYNKNRITVDTAILRYPHHLNISILMSEYKSLLDDCLAFMKDNCGIYNLGKIGFYEFEINRLARLIEYMKSDNKDENIDVATARKDFYSFVNEHDKRRNTNFLKTFPELEKFYFECKREL